MKLCPFTAGRLSRGLRVLTPVYLAHLDFYKELAVVPKSVSGGITLVNLEKCTQRFLPLVEMPHIVKLAWDRLPG